jgi:hypothetical protein
MSNPMQMPRFVVLFVLALRRALRGAADLLVPSPLLLLEQIGGLEVTAGLAAVAELGIADRLSAKPETASELAGGTGANPDALARLLRALAAQGCFRVGADGRYRNTRRSTALCSNRSGSLWHFARYFGSEHNLRAWADFLQTIRDDKSAFERTRGMTIWELFARDPTAGEIFAGAMDELTTAEASTLASAFPFTRYTSVCDVGGGRGVLLAEILARYPRLRGCLLDGPAATAGAAERLKSSGLAARVEIVRGDFFDRIPEGYDLYLMKDVLHDWDDARARRILENCRRAMSADARLLIAEILLAPNEARFPGTFADLQMMTVCSEGRQRSRADFARLFDAAGLRLVRVWPTSRFSSLVEAEIVPAP